MNLGLICQFWVCISFHLAVTNGNECLNDQNDPCEPGVYELLDDPTRCVQYFDNSSSFMNDYTLVSGWYRSITTGCLNLLTTPLVPGNCQSSQPMWLCDSLPSPAEGIVGKKVCAVNYSNTTWRIYDICVKNCENFMVYHLTTPVSASERYCFDGGTYRDETSIMTTTTTTANTELPTTTTTTELPTTTTTTELPTTTTTTELPTTTTTTELPTTTTTTELPTTTTTTKLPTTTTATQISTTTTTMTEHPTTTTTSAKGSITTKKMPTVTATIELLTTTSHSTAQPTTSDKTKVSSKSETSATVTPVKQIDKNSKKPVLYIVIGVLAAVLLVTVLVVLICCCIRNMPSHKESKNKESLAESTKPNPCYMPASYLDQTGLYADINDTAVDMTGMKWDHKDTSTFSSSGKGVYEDLQNHRKDGHMYQQLGFGYESKGVYEGLKKGERDGNIYQQLRDGGSQHGKAHHANVSWLGNDYQKSPLKY